MTRDAIPINKVFDQGIDEAIDEAIIAACPLAIIYSDREGRIRGWNTAAQTLFGHEAEGVMGQSLDIIIPERLREAHWRGFDHAMESGQPCLGPGFIRTKAVRADGKSIYVELSFALIRDGEGNCRGAAAYCRPCD